MIHLSLSLSLPTRAIRPCNKKRHRSFSTPSLPWLSFPSIRCFRERDCSSFVHHPATTYHHTTIPRPLSPPPSSPPRAPLLRPSGGSNLHRPPPVITLATHLHRHPRHPLCSPHHSSSAGISATCLFLRRRALALTSERPLHHLHPPSPQHCQINKPIRVVAAACRPALGQRGTRPHAHAHTPQINPHPTDSVASISISCVSLMSEIRTCYFITSFSCPAFNADFDGDQMAASGVDWRVCWACVCSWLSCLLLNSAASLAAGAGDRSITGICECETALPRYHCTRAETRCVGRWVAGMLRSVLESRARRQTHTERASCGARRARRVVRRFSSAAPLPFRLSSFNSRRTSWFSPTQPALHIAAPVFNPSYLFPDTQGSVAGWRARQDALLQQRSLSLTSLQEGLWQCCRRRLLDQQCRISKIIQGPAAMTSK